jgi:hypothetical protein
MVMLVPVRMSVPDMVLMLVFMRMSGIDVVLMLVFMRMSVPDVVLMLMFVRKRFVLMTFGHRTFLLHAGPGRCSRHTPLPGRSLFIGIASRILMSLR